MLIYMVLQLKFAFIKSVVHKLHKAIALWAYSLLALHKQLDRLFFYYKHTRVIYYMPVRPQSIVSHIPFHRIPQSAFELRDIQAFISRLKHVMVTC